MTGARGRIEVLHGVNLDLLGARDPLHYGTLTLADLEAQIAAWAARAGAERELLSDERRGASTSSACTRLRGPPTQVDGVILNPGAWTHYAYSIHDALELTGLPAVEVHLSDVQSREPWRRLSVIGDLCLATYLGQRARGLPARARALARGASRGGT